MSGDVMRSRHHLGNNVPPPSTFYLAQQSVDVLASGRRLANTVKGFSLGPASAI